MRSAYETQTKRTEIADAIVENARTSEQSKAVSGTETVECLASRLAAIRERIWRLQAMFAVSLSHDCAVEANHYLQLFQTLALQLKERDANVFDSLVRGHESLLLSPSVPVKQTIHIETQRLCELRWEVNRMPDRSEGRRATQDVPDGLGWML
jgi:hypothetical protein